MIEEKNWVNTSEIRHLRIENTWIWIERLIFITSWHKLTYISLLHWTVCLESAQSILLTAKALHIRSKVTIVTNCNFFPYMTYRDMNIERNDHFIQIDGALFPFFPGAMTVLRIFENLLKMHSNAISQSAGIGWQLRNVVRNVIAKHQIDDAWKLNSMHETLLASNVITWLETKFKWGECCANANCVICDAYLWTRGPSWMWRFF